VKINKIPKIFQFLILTLPLILSILPGLIVSRPFTVEIKAGVYSSSNNQSFISLGNSGSIKTSSFRLIIYSTNLIKSKGKNFITIGNTENKTTLRIEDFEIFHDELRGQYIYTQKRDLPRNINKKLSSGEKIKIIFDDKIQRVELYLEFLVFDGSRTRPFFNIEYIKH